MGPSPLAGTVLAPDEVEILATPRPGTAVAHDDGLVVVIDTELTPELRAEGDARELQRAIQELRKEAGLDLDDEVDLRVDGLAPAVAALSTLSRPKRCPAGTGSRRGRRGGRDDPPRGRPGHDRAPSSLERRARDATRMSDATAGRPLWRPFVLLALSIVIADQITKAWIVDALAPDRDIRLLGDYLRLVYTENNGALFGLFRGQAAPFALLSLAVIGLIVGYHGRSGRSPYMTLTLGLLLGGAIGNAIDRLRLGYVVDFVDGGIGSFRWYTFNVADACISASIVLLLLMAIRPSLTGQHRDG